MEYFKCSCRWNVVSTTLNPASTSPMDSCPHLHGLWRTISSPSPVSCRRCLPLQNFLPTFWSPPSSTLFCARPCRLSISRLCCLTSSLCSSGGTLEAWILGCAPLLGAFPLPSLLLGFFDDDDDEDDEDDDFDPDDLFSPTLCPPSYALVGPPPVPRPSAGGGGPGCSKSAEGLEPCF